MFVHRYFDKRYINIFWTLLTFVFSVAIFKDIPEKLKQKQKLKNFTIKIYITTKDCCAPPSHSLSANMLYLNIRTLILVNSTHFIHDQLGVGLFGFFSIQLLKKHTLNPEIILCFTNFVLKKPCLKFPKSAI